MKNKILLGVLLALIAISMLMLVSCSGGGSSENCEHEWNDICSEDPGCENGGFLEHECLNCGEIERLEFEPTGHRLVPLKGYLPTCTEPGLSDGTYCELCEGEIEPRNYISPTGHNYEIIPGYQATCYEDGLSDGERCTICAEVSVEQKVIYSNGHEWVNDWGYSATCLEDGLTDGTHCYRCNETGIAQEIIPATGHSFVNGGIDESTCTEHGYSYGTYCEYCWEVGEVGHELPLADHIPVVDKGYLPTCTSNGLTDGSHCEVCETVIEKQEVVEYTGHSVVSFGKEASTCEKMGSTEGKKCATCGYIFSESIKLEKAKHTFENGTCTVCKLTVSSGLSYEKNSLGTGYIVVGKGSFNGTSLVVPDMYEGLPVVAIGAGAFEGCTSITEAKLPKSITSVGDNAFNGCTSLEYITCEDFQQSYAWSSSWSGETEILIKSEQKDGLSAFEVYLLAMQTMQNKIDRFSMDTIKKIDVYMYEQLYQSTTNRQYYECVLNDFYSLQSDGESETKVWYIDGMCYLVQSNISAKMEASPEYFRDYTNQMMETLDVFEEKYFDNAVFFRRGDGTYNLTLVMSNENMADLVERVLGITDNSINMTSCVYSYDFDTNGYLLAMYADAEFSLTTGGYTATGVLDQDVILNEVGTLQSVTQPQGSFIDVTNKNCTHPTLYQITVSGFDATCTEDGITDGIYCANCYGTVRLSEKIEAQGHNYKNGKCTECGLLENQSTGLYYEISVDGKTVYLAGVGTFDGSSVVIPETVFGLPVVGVKSGAFDGTAVTSVTIPETVKIIEDGALGAVKTVNCPTTVVKLLPSSIESLTLTKGTAIEKNDFSSLTELKMLTLTSNINELEIADGAFENCTKLYIICNYSSLEIIEGDEESNGGIAKNTQRVFTNEDEKDRYALVGDFLFYLNGGEGYILSMYFGSGDTLVLPNSVNGESYTIPRYVFENNTEIVNIVIPRGVNSLENYAFNGCTSIKNVTAKSEYFKYIPTNAPLASVTILGDEIVEKALNNRKDLVNITISDSVTSIGLGAFMSCSKLTSIAIPAGVTSIGVDAFYGCSSLTNVYACSIENWCGIEFGNGVANPLNYADLYIDGEKVTDIVIPDTVEIINAYAFYDYKAMTSLKIGKNVTKIGDSAFWGCQGVTSLTIPESVKTIENNAFYGWRALTEINFNAQAMDDIPEGYNGSTLNHIFLNAGKDAEGIKITIGKNVTKIPNYLFCPSTYNDERLALPNITSVEFEDGSACKSIGSKSFYGCETIERITIPESVTFIGKYAFSRCISLYTVVFENKNGWSVDGTAIDLANADAGSWLTMKYADREWTCEE